MLLASAYCFAFLITASSKLKVILASILQK
jgi:hypothetical protein